MTESMLATYHHSSAGFSLPVPRKWLLRENPQDKVAVAVVEPDGDAHFRSNIVVTVDDLEPGRTLESWQEFTESLSGEALDQYLLIDTELLEFRGHPVYRRLAHHANPEGVALTMEQWSTVRGNRGYTVTGTAATMEVQHTAGLFAAVARGFRADGDVEEDDA